MPTRHEVLGSLPQSTSRRLTGAENFRWHHAEAVALWVLVRVLVDIWSRREDAFGRGNNGEQHEQGRSRQSPPQQGWRNQRQTRKHPHPHVAKDLRTEFCSRLSRNREAERSLA